MHHMRHPHKRRQRSRLRGEAQDAAVEVYKSHQSRRSRRNSGRECQGPLQYGCQRDTDMVIWRNDIFLKQGYRDTQVYINFNK
jgi:hypothetical protein